MGRRLDQLAIGRNEFGLAHALRGEPVLAPEPTVTAAQRIADDAHPGGATREPHQPVRLGFGNYVGPQHSRFDPSGLGLGVYAHAAHAGGVDQDASVAWRDDAVPRGKYPHSKALISGQAHRGYYVGRVLGYYHQRWLLMRVEVEGLSSLVVALVAWHVDRTLQGCPELLDRRGICSRHNTNLPSRAGTRQDYTKNM